MFASIRNLVGWRAQNVGMERCQFDSKQTPHVE
jgi:hypothetical protein